ncbi:hypothetical protein FA048_16510 [Pedobacter polaris]|uniref:Peptidase S74 domain-containing protein n=1 Tax=Pedobacter polaris TaxID=2571273 RepID=A0A4U1CKS6_9SPHI|nr:tail fiber domain-containing protein [Pedobacter polaris]TKC06799.1 hypothetical protein FA048_16510 [Pedobacter polaris]
MKTLASSCIILLLLSSYQLLAQQPDSALYIDRSGNTVLGANLILKGGQVLLKNGSNAWLKAGNDNIIFGTNQLTFGNGNNVTWLKASNNGFTLGNNQTGFKLNFNDIGMYTTNQDLNFTITGPGNMYFKTNGNFAMNINADGNVGINRKGTNPVNRLEIGGALHMDGNPIYFRQGTTDQSDYIKWTGVNPADEYAYDKIRISGWNGVELGVTSSNSTALSVSRAGFVGIGVNAQFPLHVTNIKGGSTQGYTQNAEAFALGYRVLTHYPTARNFSTCSIFAEGDVVSRNAFVSTSSSIYSDIRLKKDIILSSSAEDLEKIKQIEIVNYKMIDTIADHKIYKKVIAQQVEKVYPRAVGVGFSTLPNVFELATAIVAQKDSLFTISITKTKDLKIGDKVELKCEPAQDVNVEVIAIAKYNITVKSATALNEQKSVFVYGTIASNVLTVDYDAISMLNVSATQELAKMVAALQKQVVQLKTQNVAMAIENEKLKKEQANTNGNILARLAQLEGSKNKTSQQVMLAVKK